ARGRDPRTSEDGRTPALLARNGFSGVRPSRQASHPLWKTKFMWTYLRATILEHALKLCSRSADLWRSSHCTGDSRRIILRRRIRFPFSRQYLHPIKTKRVGGGLVPE